MNKKIILGILILSIFLIAGCAGVDLSKVSDKDLERISDKAIVCNKPYIRVGTSCCLDKDDNKICDNDEQVETQEKEETPEPKATSPESVNVITPQKKETVKPKTPTTSPTPTYPGVEQQGVNEVVAVEEEQVSIPSNEKSIRNFKNIYVNDGILDGVVVFGDTGSAEEVSSAVKIAEFLSGNRAGMVSPIALGTAKLASEIPKSDYTNLNTIVIGRPCENMVMSYFLGTSLCNLGLSKDESIIKLIEHPTRQYALLVFGYSSKDVVDAINFLLSDRIKEVPEGVTEVSIKYGQANFPSATAEEATAGG